MTCDAGHKNNNSNASYIAHARFYHCVNIRLLNGSTIHSNRKGIQMSTATKTTEVAAEPKMPHQVCHRPETMVFDKQHVATASDLAKLPKNSAIYLQNTRFVFDEITSDFETGHRLWVYGLNGLRGYLVTKTLLGKVRRIVLVNRIPAKSEPYLTAKPWLENDELKDENLVFA